MVTTSAAERISCYGSAMARTKASKAAAAVRKSARKPAVLPKGYGSLRGQILIRRGIDLTKPIYEQYLRLERKERRRKKR